MAAYGAWSAVSGASAVLAASTFHRRTLTITEIKRALAAAGIPVREAA